jgi:glucosamine-6-phosphate deaminase
VTARTIIVPDAQELAIRAADIIVDAVRAKPDAVLGLPTGSTPIATYAELNRRAADGTADFSRCTIFAIDEFCDATRATPGTNTAFYREHARFGARALHCPNPGASDPDEHIRAYAATLRREGGMDLCVLGIGVNGHIAFNEPGAGRDTRARVVDLHQSSLEAHAGAFGGLGDVPRRGMTLGVADLLEAPSILVLAAGAHKAGIVNRAVTGAVTPDVPASWLQQHDAVTWLLDAPAAAALGPASP